ncbi:hypothetical protein SLEP1_g26590 [Rubroshorea leprosula]|uniref:Uncharacterized protein n=1 Tax=Rubroshorea leprosula TaxID=152421 RepID=A0AAV5JUL7_9ROSI|nr:hypothetical protein SLEP1_g26590 [Rubroshorea leprosula]
MGKSPCCDKNGLKKGPWTAEEDQTLMDYIQKHGHGRWRTLPKNAGLKRCGKSCRLRWTNYLRPDIKRGKFSPEEDDAIIQLHSVLGNKWSAIAARLPGRTDNEIKNYWNTHIKKKLLRMGIDPVTHISRFDLLELYSTLGSGLYNPSQQLNLAGLLGLGSMINPELLNLAKSLLSSNIQASQPGNFQAQNQFPFFQTSQIQTPVTSSSTTNAYLLQNTQLLQANLNQFSAIPTNICQDYGYDDLSDQSIITQLAGNQGCFSGENIQNMGFGSLLSTPSSSSTPLNSSSTTYVNGASTEDERDSYGSNMLMFDVPNNFNSNVCL